MLNILMTECTCQLKWHEVAISYVVLFVRNNQLACVLRG